MKHRNQFFHFTIAAGMELCWLYACMSFLMAVVFDYPLSPAITTFIFLGGSLTTFICHRQFSRNILKYLLYASSFLLFFTLIFYYQIHPGFSQLNPDGIYISLSSDLILLSLFFFVLILVTWIRSTIQVTRILNKHTLFPRFDLGLAVFAVLISTKSFLAVKFSIDIPNPTTGHLFYIYFFWGMLACCKVQNDDTAHRQPLLGHNRTALIFALAVAILLAAIVLFFCFQTHVIYCLSTLLDKLKGETDSFLPILMYFLNFLIQRKPQKSQKSEAAAVSDHQETPLWGEITYETGQLGNHWFWLALLLFVLFIAFLLFGWLIIQFITPRLKHLLDFLWSRNGSGGRNKGIEVWNELILWLKGLLSSAGLWLIRRIRGYQTGKELFIFLQKWGKRSGLAYHQGQTPLEYHQLLVNLFPALDKEISLITESVYQEIYAVQPLSPKQRAANRTAVTKLKHPIFWPQRIKAWYMSDRRF